MTVHNCPLCELRFASRSECEWHLRNEHRHDDRHHRPADPANRPELPGPDPRRAP
jgi:hypothetical protein